MVRGEPRPTRNPTFVNTNITGNGQAAAVVVRGTRSGEPLADLRESLRKLHGSIASRGKSPEIQGSALMRRVVVTGMGMVTPVGNDVESTWAALLEGKSGVGTISLFDARTFPTRIAAEVKDFRLDRYRHDASRWADHSRNTKFALAAAQMAVQRFGPARVTARL